MALQKWGSACCLPAQNHHQWPMAWKLVIEASTGKSLNIETTVMLSFWTLTIWVISCGKSISRFSDVVSRPSFPAAKTFHTNFPENPRSFHGQQGDGHVHPLPRQWMVQVHKPLILLLLQHHSLQRLRRYSWLLLSQKGTKNEKKQNTVDLPNVWRTKPLPDRKVASAVFGVRFGGFHSAFGFYKSLQGSRQAAVFHQGNHSTKLRICVVCKGHQDLFAGIMKAWELLFLYI